MSLVWLIACVLPVAGQVYICQVRPELGDPPSADRGDWYGSRLCRRTRTARCGWKRRHWPGACRLACCHEELLRPAATGYAELEIAQMIAAPPAGAAVKAR